MSVDKLEERTLYNSERKFMFLRERYIDDDTRRNAGFFLQRCRNCEYAEHTDLSQFNKEQFIKLFSKYIKARQLQTLATYHSFISAYQEWCSVNSDTVLSYNINELSKNEKQSLLFQTDYLTKEDIYTIVDNPLYDIRGRAIIFLIYEGLSGKEYSEITHLKIDQIKENCIDVLGERSRNILVPKKLTDFLFEISGLKELTNNTFNVKLRIKKINLFDNGYIIKTSRTSGEPLKLNQFHTLVRNIIFDYIGAEVKLPLHFIENSGKMNYMHRLRCELGVTSKELDKSIYEKLCYRYGMNKNLFHSLKTMLELNNDEDIYDNDFEHTEIVNSILNYMPLNFTNDKEDIKENNNQTDNGGQSDLGDEKKSTPDWLDVCAELGIFGEKLAENILALEFPIVQNVSKKYTLGYDIKVFDEYDHSYFYEVKTSFKNRFFISSNELAKANFYKEKYSILFIHVDSSSREVKAVEINNPINFLGIEFDIITSNTSLFYNCSLTSSSFCIQISEDILSKGNLIADDIIEKCKANFY
jgi:hypothetical protein